MLDAWIGKPWNDQPSLQLALGFWNFEKEKKKRSSDLQ